MKRDSTPTTNQTINNNRLIFIAIETTGLLPETGHRIIEIAAIEYTSGSPSERVFHCYLNPERHIDAAAQQVHGLTLDFLNDKPCFNQIADQLIHFIKDSILVIHNAPFVTAFLNAEFTLAGRQELHRIGCEIIDSLILAKSLRRGSRNTVNALCNHYGIKIPLQHHGALLGAELLAQVFAKLQSA